MDFGFNASKTESESENMIKLAFSLMYDKAILIALSSAVNIEAESGSHIVVTKLFTCYAPYLIFTIFKSLQFYNQ